MKYRLVVIPPQSTPQTYTIEAEKYNINNTPCGRSVLTFDRRDGESFVVCVSQTHSFSLGPKEQQ